MFTGQFKRNSLLLLFTVFAANLVYYGNIFSLPYLFKDEYCAVMNSTNLNVTFVDIDCTFSKSELMATLEVSAAEFLSIPIFALLVEKLGRIKTGMILGVATAISTAACVPCLGLILFKSELFLQRMVVNAWLLLIFIYSPELYPTYIRSAAFGMIMVFCNLGGAFASLIVYDVGLDYSFRAMFLFLSPFALSGAILTFYFKEETKGKLLVDNKTQEDTELKTITDQEKKQSSASSATDEEKCSDRKQMSPY
ncbi:putative transporter SVOPL [Bolinopsis microptera]|uniref:putative transporter SVOPL n=1 Tax=Bolinopsis microptera TaxID=2820187 RepID=UPI00307A8F98